MHQGRERARSAQLPYYGARFARQQSDLRGEAVESGRDVGRLLSVGIDLLEACTAQLCPPCFHPKRPPRVYARNAIIATLPAYPYQDSTPSMLPPNLLLQGDQPFACRTLPTIVTIRHCWVEKLSSEIYVLQKQNPNKPVWFGDASRTICRPRG